eukprot:c10128_g2_i1.p1 GENE.c10128_g2_i1~~c10128_g2_i1.p1  ORF type:complete len:145 (-),score=18.50 c10128_g2_i1:400-834(-)
MKPKRTGRHLLGDPLPLLCRVAVAEVAAVTKNRSGILFPSRTPPQAFFIAIGSRTFFRYTQTFLVRLRGVEDWLLQTVELSALLQHEHTSTLGPRVGGFSSSNANGIGKSESTEKKNDRKNKSILHYAKAFSPKKKSALKVCGR